MTAPTISPAPTPHTTPATVPTLRKQFDAQRTAFASGAPDYQRRIAALNALRDGLLARKEELAAAISADFGGRSRDETLLLELFPLLDQIRHAKRHLRKWMRPKVVGSTWFLLPSRAYVVHQPLGVVGVIGAWNYQILLTLGPLVDALAAGNHVMLKPSEVTPRSASLRVWPTTRRPPATRLSTRRIAPDMTSPMFASRRHPARATLLPAAAGEPNPMASARRTRRAGPLRIERAGSPMQAAARRSSAVPRRR